VLHFQLGDPAALGVGRGDRDAPAVGASVGRSCAPGCGRSRRAITGNWQSAAVRTSM
jgi:hypothetical protein